MKGMDSRGTYEDMRLSILKAEQQERDQPKVEEFIVNDPRSILT